MGWLDQVRRGSDNTLNNEMSLRSVEQVVPIRRWLYDETGGPIGRVFRSYDSYIIGASKDRVRFR